MTQFKLSRQPPGATLSKFHVLDSAGSIIGSINVQNEEADDLQKHWVASAPAPRAATTGKQSPMINAMVRAAKKHPLNRAAVLRGC